MAEQGAENDMVRRMALRNKILMSSTLGVDSRDHDWVFIISCLEKPNNQLCWKGVLYLRERRRESARVHRNPQEIQTARREQVGGVHSGFGNLAGRLRNGPVACLKTHPQEFALADHGSWRLRPL